MKTTSTRRTRATTKSVLCLLGAALVGCTKPPTQLYVRVRSDFDEGQVERVRATVAWVGVANGGIGLDAGRAPEYQLTAPGGEIVRRFPGSIVVAPREYRENVPVDIVLNVAPRGAPAAAFDVKARVRFARNRTAVVDMFVPSLCGDPSIRDRCLRRSVEEGVEYTCAGEGDDPCIRLREQTAAPWEPDSSAPPVDVRRRDAATEVETDSGVDSGVDAGVDSGVDAGVDSGVDTGSDAGVIGHPSTAMPMVGAQFSGRPTRFRVRVGADCTGADAVRLQFCSRPPSTGEDCGPTFVIGATMAEATVTGCGQTLTITPTITLPGPGRYHWRAQYLRSGTMIGNSSPWRPFFVRRTAVTSAGPLGARVDLDADGRGDLVVRAGGMPAPDRAYYLYGRNASVGSPVAFPRVAAGTLIGSRSVPVESGAAFASSMLFLGDAEGDADFDLLVADPGASAGVGWVHRFRSAPDMTGIFSLRFNTSDALAGPAAAGGDFGSALAAGDFDDDGYIDVLVGAAQEDSSRGAVYVFRGGPLGFTPRGAPVRRAGAVAMGRFGAGIAASCDLSGDGIADAAIGAPGEHAVYVYFGRPGLGLDFDNPRTIRSTGSAPDTFGSVLACDGDFDGDGVADLVVSAERRATPNTIEVFRGGASLVGAMTPITTPFWQTAAMTVNDRLGSAVRFTGPLFGSVGDTLVVGESELVTASTGFVKFYQNPSSSAVQVINPAMAMATVGARFGQSLQVLADLDSDGLDEIAVGGPDSDGSIGAVWIYRPDAVGINFARRITGPSMVNSGFGETLAQ